MRPPATTWCFGPNSAGSLCLRARAASGSGPGDEPWGGQDEHPIGALSSHGREGALVLRREAHGHRLNPEPQGWVHYRLIS